MSDDPVRRHLREADPAARNPMSDPPGESKSFTRPVEAKVAPTDQTFSDFLVLIAGLAADLDDLRNAADSIDTMIYIDDDTDIEAVTETVDRLVSDVDDLVREVSDFCESADASFRRMFGGDRGRLNRLKRETKKFRRQQSLTSISQEFVTEDPFPGTPYYRSDRVPPGPDGAVKAMNRRAEGSGFKPALQRDVDSTPPAISDAARHAPPGYTPGKSEQGDAGGEENQDQGEL